MEVSGQRKMGRQKRKDMLYKDMKETGDMSTEIRSTSTDNLNNGMPPTPKYGNRHEENLLVDVTLQMFEIALDLYLKG